MFYLDSPDFVKGSPVYANFFRTLKQEFPDILLIPEGASEYHYGAGSAQHVSAAYFNLYSGTTAQTKTVYPNAFSVVDIGAGQNQPNMQLLGQAVKNGDILMFPGYFDTPEVLDVQQAYALALTLP